MTDLEIEKTFRDSLSIYDVTKFDIVRLDGQTTAQMYVDIAPFINSPEPAQFGVAYRVEDDKLNDTWVTMVAKLARNRMDQKVREYGIAA